MWDQSCSNDEVQRKLELSQKQVLIFGRDLAKVYRADKTARQLLQVLHEKLRAIVDSMSDGTLATDEEFLILDVNKTFERMFNLSQVKLVSLPLSQVFSVSELEKKLRQMQKRKLRFASLEWQPDKSLEQFYQVNISEIKAQKKDKKGYVLLFRDITERKRLERLKTRFVTFASHEIRTPLHGLIGFLNLMYENLQTRLDNEEKRHFQLLIDSGENLKNIIEEMFQFSAVGDESALVHPREITVRELLQIPLQRISSGAEALGLKISLVGKQDISLFVDAHLVAKAIESILKSIAAHASDDETSIQIQSAKEGQSCRITLCCKNVYLDDTELDALLNDQYNMDTRISAGSEGWRIGFPLAHDIIQWHHGSIKVQKQKDEMSVWVVITLPVSLN